MVKLVDTLVSVYDVQVRVLFWAREPKGLSFLRYWIAQVAKW